MESHTQSPAECGAELTTKWGGEGDWQVSLWGWGVPSSGGMARGAGELPDGQ